MEQGQDNREDVPISVVLPTYNRENTISRAIDSVLSQTFENFELLVIDDGSADNTGEIVKSYDDGRIIYIKQENRGANAARNKGVELATGKYISFIDSDTEYLPKRLENVIYKFENESERCAGVYTSTKAFHDDEIVSISRKKSRVEYNDIIRGNVVGGIWCTTFKQDIFEKVGYLDECMDSEQDYEFYIRVLNSGYYMVGTDDILSYSHISENGISRNIERKISGQNRLLKKHKEKMTDRAISRIYYSRYFLYAREEENMKLSRENLKKSISKYPYDPLYYYHYFFSLFGLRGFGTSMSIKRCVKMKLFD